MFLFTCQAARKKKEKHKLVYSRRAEEVDKEEEEENEDSAKTNAVKKQTRHPPVGQQTNIDGKTNTSLNQRGMAVEPRAAGTTTISGE